jgi:hypothetical protein
VKSLTKFPKEEDTSVCVGILKLVDDFFSAIACKPIKL